MIAPFISVVIPTHDRRDMLMMTVRSVLRQRDVDLEVIVVDDGSSDGTSEAVRSPSDDRVVVLRNERPLKVAAARNIGIHAARGRWVGTLDDDDLWAPTKLAKQLEAIEASSAAWAYTGIVEINGEGRYLGGEPPPAPEVLVDRLTERNLMPAGSSNVLVRSEVMAKAGGFDPQLRHLADWDLWLRLRDFGPPACVSEPLVAYRVHAAQASMDTSDMLTEARTLEARHGIDPASVLRWLAWTYLRQGRRRDAVRAYRLAVLSGGDLRSIGRAVVAAVHPDPIALRRPRATARSTQWRQRAYRWLDEATG